MWYRITCKALCFGVQVSDSDRVKDAAPVGRWMVGNWWPEILRYWNLRGASIEKLNV